MTVPLGRASHVCTVLTSAGFASTAALNASRLVNETMAASACAAGNRTATRHTSKRPRCPDKKSERRQAERKRVIEVPSVDCPNGSTDHVTPGHAARRSDTTATAPVLKEVVTLSIHNS